MKEMNIKPVNTQPSFRETCLRYFYSDPELHVMGGWGFTKEDAIIIDKNDAIVPKDEPFDGV